MTPRLPDTLLVLERGWLSANSVLGFAGDTVTVIDSGYVTHAAQTVDLITHALAGRRLERLINTHSHSDHIGGNAALQDRFGCRITVPAGLDATIAEWDEAALLLSPLGQQGARFQHDDLIAAGDEFSMGELTWQAIAVPGHDMDALAYYNPERRILISGDALWENGFGVIFPELLGSADGLQHTQATLDKLGRLPIDLVIPGHGAPFAEVDRALNKAYQRLTQFQASVDSLAWHAIKVLVAFALLERQRIAEADFPAFVLGLPFAVDVNARYLGLAEDVLVSKLVDALAQSGLLRRDGNDFVTA